MRSCGSNMTLWTDGWEFLKVPLGTGYEDACAHKKEFAPVELPHDWLIYDAHNLYEDSYGWYHKVFENPLDGGAEGSDGERMMLRFDGVYMDCTVYVNGKAVADWKYGYTTFDVDVTDQLKKGKNEILVLVRHQSPNSRWYSGAGIYRNVWMKVCKKAYLPMDGTYVVAKPRGAATEENHSFELSITTEVCAQTNAASAASAAKDNSGKGAKGSTPETSNLRVEYEIAEEPLYDFGDSKTESEEHFTKKFAGTWKGATWSADVKATEAPAIEALDTATKANAALDTATKANAAPAMATKANAAADTATKADADAATATSESDANTACAGTANANASLRTVIEDPALWDMKSPYCYRLTIKLFDGEELLDWQTETIGFRSIGFTPNEGLFLNGRTVKIQGVCEHHDLGCLGAAFHEKALERQFKILREMGANSIRTSHNPPAPEFMELCDRMGFLVDAECFDMWERSKTTYDYARFFKDWAQRDVRSWVRRDRNHPSVFLWSIGNEIYDTHADAHGQEITKCLMEYVRENDPEGNAQVTIASNYMPWEGAQKCADLVKLAGYNYGEKCYAAHHAAHPDWILYGSETTSVVQSRGIYHFPLSQSILSDEDEQCSALGNSATSWGAESTQKALTDHRDAPYVFGHYIWTGFDYIGEPTPYHTKNSYFGQIDTAGFPKDSFYMFRSEWTNWHEKPMVHLFPYWDFNEGQMIDVCACSNAPQVELFVNGRRQGRQQLEHESGKHLMGNWRVPYEPGVITAIAYDEDGKELCREERRSFGDSRQISLTPDRFVMNADPEDMIFLTIETLDAKGHPVENAVDYVTVRIEGPARLLGMDNGDSTDYDEYKTDTRKLFSGKLLAVIASTGEAGDIRVVASGEGLKECQVLLEARKAGAKWVAGASQQAKDTLLPAKEGKTVKSCLEDCSGKQTGAKKTSAKNVLAHAYVPTRKLEITAEDAKCKLSRRKKEMYLQVRILPENATPDLIWKVVGPGGIELPVAKIEEVTLGQAQPDKAQASDQAPPDKAQASDQAPGTAPKSASNVRMAKVSALGDGDFLVRCMAKEPDGKITVISELDFSAKGFGQAFLDPYGFITGGLYTKSKGDIGNGNEKGFSFSREGESAVLFENIDFGEFGSDEITIPIFALSSEAYSIELWEGMPGEDESKYITTLTYQKPSIWNTYQEETWKLPRRLSGVTSLGMRMKDEKIHVKGFSFRKLNKAFEVIKAAEASRIYGDEFTIAAPCVNGIGNNVTMEFENMDFGETGADGITVTGWTPLAVNTIHLRFRPEGSNEFESRMVEFKGTGKEAYEPQTFTFEKLTGKGRMDLVFLPGCQFNMESIRFRKVEE